MKHIAIFLISTFAIADVYTIDGQYQVPSTPELQQYATFKMKYKVEKDEKGKLTYNYTLPQELTGREVKIELKQAETTKSGFTEFTGSNVIAASCFPTQTNVQCQIFYDKFHIDLGEVSSYVKKNFDSKEYSARMQQALMFRSDPGGSFRYSKKGTNLYR